MKNQDEFAVQDIAAIQKHIISIRNVHAILDRDLAVMYDVEVKHLNRQVKRNIERFPADFMFQLTKEECIRCQYWHLVRKRREIAELVYLSALCLYGERCCNVERCTEVTDCSCGEYRHHAGVYGDAAFCVGSRWACSARWRYRIATTRNGQAN